MCLRQFFCYRNYFFYSKSATYSEISKTNEEFLNFTADKTWTALKSQIKSDVTALTVARAIQMNDEIQEMQSEVLRLSKKMSNIVSNFADYNAREVFDPRGSELPEKIPYIFYSEEIANNSSLAYEIARVANIGDDLQYASENYEPYKNSCYIASENGYFICVDYYPPEYHHSEFMDNNFTFDARKRPWYENIKQVQKLTFSDVYRDTDNDLSITCAAPYYNNGQFAGVVGIGTNNIFRLYQKIINPIDAEGRNCFILNQEGELLISSFDSGILAVTEKDNNLYETPDSLLSEIAKKWSAAKQGLNQ